MVQVDRVVRDGTALLLSSATGFMLVNPGFEGLSSLPNINFMAIFAWNDVDSWFVMGVRVGLGMPH